MNKKHKGGTNKWVSLVNQSGARSANYLNVMARRFLRYRPHSRHTTIQEEMVAIIMEMVIRAKAIIVEAVHPMDARIIHQDFRVPHQPLVLRSACKPVMIAMRIASCNPHGILWSDFASVEMECEYS